MSQSNDSGLNLDHLEALHKALKWALEWIDAVPDDTPLPAMPGFDRDYVNGLLARRAAPVAAPTAIKTWQERAQLMFGDEWQRVGSLEQYVYAEIAELRAALANQPAPLALPARDELTKALQTIARWQGEFPDTGKTWADGSPMSYSACYGNNGERDYMRQIALDALAHQPAQKQAEDDLSIEADAYMSACDEMERWQKKRAKAGIEIGTEGSLVDGIGWLYSHIEKLEAAQQEPVAAPQQNAAPLVSDQSIKDVVSYKGFNFPVWQDHNSRDRNKPKHWHIFISATSLDEWEESARPKFGFLENFTEIGIEVNGHEYRTSLREIVGLLDDKRAAQLDGGPKTDDHR